MVVYELSQDSALTILLHAAKYPSCTINGLLLGKPSASSPQQLSKAIPLFHTSSAYLAPCVETALTQVDAYAQQQGLQILGYYHAEYRNDAQDIHATGKRVADKIADKAPGACVVALNSSKLAAFCGVQPELASSSSGGKQQLQDAAAAGGQLPFDLYQRESPGVKGSWKRVPPGSSTGQIVVSTTNSSSSGSSEPSSAKGGEALQKRFLNLFNSSRHLQLADFDEHMDDLARDYTNTQLLPPDTALLSR